MELLKGDKIIGIQLVKNYSFNLFDNEEMKRTQEKVPDESKKRRRLNIVKLLMRIRMIA